MLNGILRCNIVTTAMVEPRLRFLEYMTERYAVEFTVYRASDWWYRDSNIVKQIIIGEQPICVNWWPNGPLVIHYHHQAVKAISRKNFDLVIGFGYSSLTNMIAQLKSRIKKIPYILWTGAKEDNEVGRDIITRKLKHYMNRSADFCLASSTLTAEYMQMYGVPEERIAHALYAIDNDAFEKRLRSVAGSQLNIRQKYGVPKSCKIVLCVSRIIDYKCIDVLIKTWKDISRHGWRLIIAGDGPDFEKNRKLVKELCLNSIHLLGNVAHKTIHELYAIADLFVLPSAGDIWGLVINEAMLAGLPIVTTYMVGAHRDMVEEGRNGFVVTPRDQHELAIALDRVMADDAVRKRMSTRSKEIVSQHNFAGTERAFLRALSALDVHINTRIRVASKI